MADIVLPPEVVPPRIAAVVWATIRGADSYRQVAAACGWVSPSEPMEDLRDARRLGLVDFEDRKHGTLRATAEVVALTPRDRD